MSIRSSAELLDGKKVAQSIQDQLSEKVRERVSAGFRVPGLAVVLVGADPASSIYVGRKQKVCKSIGFHSDSYSLPEDTSQESLLQLIETLNNDPAIHGILVQLPLPGHLMADEIIDAITPAKDVDGFHPYNVGRLALKKPLMRSCTPKGVMRLLENYGFDFVGQEVVIVGASNIVGRPMALEVLKALSTVTICHSKTKDLEQHVRRADLVVVGIGCPEFIPGEWIKPGATVIDIGINRLASGKLVGDVDFEGASRRATAITPVPGGVGPMTVAMLMENTFEAAVSIQSQQ